MLKASTIVETKALPVPTANKRLSAVPVWSFRTAV